MLFCATAFSQNGAYRQKTSIVTASPLLIDSLSIIPASLEIRIENKFIKEHEYQLNVLNNTITFDEKWIGHVALLKYQVLTWNWKQDIYLLDTSMITQPLIAPYRFRAEKTGARMGFSETDELQKQGSISRAVVVGNGQNTSVNSDLNLQISGKISDNIYVRANVTDRSIPVQPEGNTQSLQEFDQVFVEVWNDHNKLVVGDFETRSNESYFLAYQKRARGMLFQSNTQDEKKFTSKVGGALSRGKFNRMTLAGVEGNQGPYRLKGADLESFIVVLAGTERVYINGIPLERGLDRDYTIDYNNAEVTFTANRLITKDSRIIVEFQYADQQYARVLLLGEQAWENEHLHIYTKYYQESDAKNQPLQIDLNDDVKALLTGSGDPAFNEPLLVSGARNVGYNSEFIQYAIIDTLGFSDVYLYSTHSDSALYTVGFTKVSFGLGDYVLTNPLANGKIYKWVAPDTVGGVLQRNGDYVPLRKLTPPQKQILWTNGAVYVNKGWLLSGELAYSELDLNTFSSLNDEDNQGLAYKLKGQKKVSLGNQKSLTTHVSMENQNNTFKAIERFRDVEFERDWNILNNPVNNKALHQYEAGINFNMDSLGFFSANFQHLTIDSIISGDKGTSQWDLKHKNFTSQINVSALNNKTNEQYFIRHQGKHEILANKLTYSYEDEREENAQFNGDSLNKNGYQFYWYRLGLTYQFDDLKSVKVFGGQRLDRISNGFYLKKAAQANETGITLNLSQLKNQNVKATVQFRELILLDTNLITLSPESTLLWQLQYNGRLAKGLIQQQLFAEFGSGLERKKSFQFVQVPIGQGVYSYSDFNENGQQELDEFYISPFPYEANYVKVYLPTQEYIKANSGRLNYSLTLQPSAIWLNKTGVKNWVSKLSTQHTFGYFTKTSDSEVLKQLLKEDKPNELLSRENNQTHRLYINQFNPAHGLLYSYQNTSNVILLTDGFQERFTTLSSLTLRKMWKSVLQTLITLNKGENGTQSDLLTQQNYTYTSKGIKPEITAIINKHISSTLQGRYEIKYATSNVYLSEANWGLQFTHPNFGNIQANVGLVNTNKPDLTNASLKLELLEGYVPGLNYTWSMMSQQQIAENLQLTINYQARSSKTSPTIHVGTIQLRAYF